MCSSGPTFFEFVIKFLFWNTANQLAKNKPIDVCLDDKKKIQIHFSIQKLFSSEKKCLGIQSDEIRPPTWLGLGAHTLIIDPPEGHAVCLRHTQPPWLEWKGPKLGG